MNKHQVTLLIVVIVALALFMLSKNTVTAENYRNAWERRMERIKSARRAARRRAAERRRRQR
jgi:F0F1-type ATP synthase membrane subunit b/b'